MQEEGFHPEHHQGVGDRRHVDELAAVPVLTVAFSRVYRGMHFTTDVLAGLLLGAGALAAAAVATRSSWLASHPAAERRGGGRDLDLTDAEAGR